MCGRTVFWRAVFVLAVATLVEGAQEHFRWLRRSECTSSVPALLQPFGVDNLCADITLEGCSEIVRVGIRFASQEHALVEQELSMSSGTACASAGSLGHTAIDEACGTSWSLCATFDRSGATTLQIGQNYLAGCPTIQVHPEFP